MRLLQFACCFALLLPLAAEAGIGTFIVDSTSYRLEENYRSELIRTMQNKLPIQVVPQSNGWQVFMANSAIETTSTNVIELLHNILKANSNDETLGREAISYGLRFAKKYQNNRPSFEVTEMLRQALANTYDVDRSVFADFPSLERFILANRLHESTLQLREGRLSIPQILLKGQWKTWTDIESQIPMDPNTGKMTNHVFTPEGIARKPLQQQAEKREKEPFAKEESEKREKARIAKEEEAKKADAKRNADQEEAARIAAAKQKAAEDEAKKRDILAQKQAAEDRKKEEEKKNQTLFENKTNRRITIGTTYIGGNPERDELSKIVTETHTEYATMWGLSQEVEDKNLLKYACTVNNRSVDCEAYWNKIAVLRRWLYNGNPPDSYRLKYKPWSNKHSPNDEWYIMVDDDMPVTNMGIDPYKAIEQLRGYADTSIIIALDVINWNGDYQTAINTGLMIVRKDDASREFFDELWEERNTLVNNAPSYCPTLGVCQRQHTLHEQQGFANLLQRDRNLIGTVVSVVKPRESNSYSDRSHIALNTFHRAGCFYRDQGNWVTNRFAYNDPESGHWRPGDWMGQTAGVPLIGWWCGDWDAGRPKGPIRLDMIKQMTSQIVRDFIRE